MQGALIRFRIIAWIVGICLIALVVVGMPLKYLGHDDTVVAAVGPAHGFLFMVYLALTFDLSHRANWPFRRMVLVMVSGTIPFLSFWTERKVTREWSRPDEAGIASSLA